MGQRRAVSEAPCVFHRGGRVRGPGAQWSYAGVVAGDRRAGAAGGLWWLRQATERAVRELSGGVVRRGAAAGETRAGARRTTRGACSRPVRERGTGGAPGTQGAWCAPSVAGARQGAGGGRAGRDGAGGRSGAAAAGTRAVGAAGRAARGHDPAHRIALAAAGELRRGGIPAGVVPVLRQRRPVTDQSGLGASQRQVNLAGALEVVAGGERLLAAERVVLVDDLMTTGASLTEAARAVEAAGGRRGPGRGTGQAAVVAASPTAFAINRNC